MKIKTPAEAVGRPFCHESEHRIGFWSVWWLDFTGGGAGRISKNEGVTTGPKSQCLLRFHQHLDFIG